MSLAMPLGPVMLDVAGPRLTAEERALLAHPLVGGVILFTRNFFSIEQVCALTTEIHSLRQPPLLIAVDHEGGRVQRFREGYTRLPPMRRLGELWECDAEQAKTTTEALGFVLAAELRASGVDLSFTPVLDLDYGCSAVIGDRAFHRDPAIVIELAAALIAGLSRAGMANAGKHFPGHGYVTADSHHAIPIDSRPMPELAEDMAPYREHRRLGLAAVMPAHVIYDKIDHSPAGFSSYWLQEMLRGELDFGGVIFSDDLSMEGASVAGGIIERALAAVSAGCDMVLVCNNAIAARQLLANWQPDFSATSADRLQALLPTLPAPSWLALRADDAYRQAVGTLKSLEG